MPCFILPEFICEVLHVLLIIFSAAIGFGNDTEVVLVGRSNSSSNNDVIMSLLPDGMLLHVVYGAIRNKKQTLQVFLYLSQRDCIVAVVV